MTRLLLASLLPLAFLMGCGDGSENPGNGDPDCTANCGDDDTDVTPFAATIVATTPFEGVTVSVAVRNSGDWEVIECDGTTCTFEVDEAGEFSVAAENTYTFVNKQVDVAEPGEFQVSWVAGGCASDPEWDPASACDEWVPGEYGFPMLEGSYTDEIWGAQYDIEVEIVDSTMVVHGLARSESATFGDGDYFYTVNEDGKWQAGVVIDEGTFQLLVSKSDGSVDEFLFHRD